MKYLGINSTRVLISRIKAALNNKVDLVNGAVQMEQMPADVKKTVEKAKKREVRYIPFKAIRLESIYDGRYENRYVFNEKGRLLIFIRDERIKKVKIYLEYGLNIKSDTIYINIRHDRVAKVHSKSFIYELPDDISYPFYIDAYIDGFSNLAKFENCTNVAYRPCAYTVDNDGLATIDIDALPINDSITFGKADYKLINGNIKYTGRVVVGIGSIKLTKKVDLINGKKKRNVYKIIRKETEFLRKGEENRKSDDGYRNLLIINGGNISKHRVVFSESVSRLYMFRDNRYYTTLAVMKISRLGHKSIYGYDKYKVKGRYNSLHEEFEITEVQRI